MRPVGAGPGLGPGSSGSPPLQPLHPASWSLCVSVKPPAPSDLPLLPLLTKVCCQGRRACMHPGQRRSYHAHTMYHFEPLEVWCPVNIPTFKKVQSKTQNMEGCMLTLGVVCPGVSTSGCLFPALDSWRVPGPENYKPALCSRHGPCWPFPLCFCFFGCVDSLHVHVHQSPSFMNYA